MTDYIRFCLQNKRLVSFGFLLTFFSSFGQTFLLSLYVPQIIKEFSLSNSSFGLLYGAATICSAIALAYTGKAIDRRSLRSFTMTSVILLMLSCLVLAFSYNVLFVFIGLWGLRLAGQGLLSHISNTSISKCFVESRGKALSLSVMGYPLGEGILPVIIGMLIVVLGWRQSMFISSMLIGFVLLPFIMFALNKAEFKNPPSTNEQKEYDDAFTRTVLFKDPAFYALSLNAIILPTLITGFFFYQSALAAEKGWGAELIPACFVGYAVARTIFSLLSGRMIDKFSALKMLPFHLIPFFMGLLAVALFKHPVVAPLYLVLTGMSMGMSSTIKSAMLAEVYGTDNLGSIRSMLAMMMVLGTAVSPVVFGVLIDRGFGFILISGISAFLVLVTAFFSYYIYTHISAKSPRAEVLPDY